MLLVHVSIDCLPSPVDRPPTTHQRIVLKHYSGVLLTLLYNDLLVLTKM
jgi:hypothetical protein